MKTGIFGGSFNPIHTGHAILTNFLMAHTNLDRILMMVSPQNPLKETSDRSMDIHRLKMTELVASRIDGVTVSALEFSMPRPSYTIDTLRRLETLFPEDKFVLIIGADNWANFPHWRENETIISRYEIMIYPRYGYSVDKESLPENVTYIENAPLIEVSSTQIREIIQNGGNPAFFVPKDVEAYILINNLYKH